jgi:hypothetical protein
MMMGALLVWFTWLLLNDGPEATTHFTGGPVMAVFIFGLFAFVFAFGVAALKAGLFQIRHDRRDPSAVRWAGVMMMFLSGAGLLVGVLEAILDR